MMPEGLKVFVFGLIVVVVLGVTAYLVGSTIYKNITSETKGPVHWHADFEIYKCGAKLDLINPQGWSNRVGTPVLHEHNDGRIHVEGVIDKLESITLGSFFKAVGGKLSNDSLIIPISNGFIELGNNQSCSSGQALLQVFVLKVEEKKIVQQKLTNPENYILSPYSATPPGDCIIFEQDLEKLKTDKLCQQYQVKKQKGELYD